VAAAVFVSLCLLKREKKMDNEKITVLLIDDEADLIDAVAFQLKAKKGYNVVTAYNGLEGLEKLKEITPALIVLDMNMPKMGGIEFYKNIIGDDYRAKYPVLVLTARANLEQLFMDLNVDGFMTKPFDLDNLFNEIDVIIRKRYEKARIEEHKKDKLKPKKILIVDNKKEAFDKIAIAFLNEGYLVSSSNSGLATIDRIMVDVPDIILIKLGLDDLHGDLVIAKLKQMPKTMGIPCVLYTPEDERLNRNITEQICKDIGISALVESDDPYILIREAEIALHKTE